MKRIISGMLFPLLTAIAMLVSCSPDGAQLEGYADITISISEDLPDSKLISYDGSSTGGIREIDGYVIVFSDKESGTQLNTGILGRDTSSEGMKTYTVTNVPFGIYDITVNAVMRKAPGGEEYSVIGYGSASSVTFEEGVTAASVAVSTWAVASAIPEMTLAFEFPDKVFSNPIDTGYSLALYLDDSASPFYQMAAFFPEDAEEVNSGGSFQITRDSSDFSTAMTAGNHIIRAEIRSADNRIVYKGAEAMRLLPDMENSGFFPVTGTIHMAVSSESEDYESPASYTITIDSDTGLLYDLSFEQDAMQVTEGNDARIFVPDGLIAKDADIRFYVDGIDITETFETEYAEQDGQYGTRYIIPREMLVLGNHIFRMIVKTEGFYGIMSIDVPLLVV